MLGVGFGVVAGNAPRARAQSAEAEAMFNDGNRLMSDGKLAEACAAFDASNRVEQRAGTLIRLGECREQNHQLASAWSAYKDALTRVKDPRKREFAAAKAAALEARLSYLTVSVSDDSRIEGLALTRAGKPFDAMLWNRALPVDGGDYIITGRAPGHEEWQTTAHVPIEGARISVEVPKFKELGKLAPSIAPPPGPPPGGATEPAAAAGAAGSTVRFTTRRKLATGLAVASVIGVVVGAVLGESSSKHKDDAFALCPDPAMPCMQADRANTLLQASHDRTFQANLTFGLAAAAAIGAGVLWFTGGPAAESPRRIGLAPHVVPGAAGVGVVGRF